MEILIEILRGIKSMNTENKELDFREVEIS